MGVIYRYIRQAGIYYGITSAIFMIKHVVLLSLKKELSKKNIEDLMRYFEHVANNVEGMVRFEWGGIRDELKGEGYTHCVIISFRSLIAKEMYLICREYLSLGERLCQSASRISVFDIDVSSCI
jgi:hypothetical protein